VSQKTLKRSFEFVATKSTLLNKIEQNYDSFSEHFNNLPKDKNVISFSNLNNDSLLIVPRPRPLNYKNISQFTKNAPNDQQVAF
jgi:hypothetical protein